MFKSQNGCVICRAKSSRFVRYKNNFQVNTSTFSALASRQVTVTPRASPAVSRSRTRGRATSAMPASWSSRGLRSSQHRTTRTGPMWWTPGLGRGWRWWPGLRRRMRMWSVWNTNTSTSGKEEQMWRKWRLTGRGVIPKAAIDQCLPPYQRRQDQQNQQSPSTQPSLTPTTGGVPPSAAGSSSSASWGRSWWTGGSTRSAPALLIVRRWVGRGRWRGVSLVKMIQKLKQRNSSR